MQNRREFLNAVGNGALALAAPWPALADETIRSRPLPGSEETLPVVGLGNSVVFRSDDTAAARELLGLFHRHGGRYVDCMGSGRFHVAGAVREIGLGEALFLGDYFNNDDEAAMRDNVHRLLELSGKQQLDLVQAYPGYADYNRKLFRRWREEGLTRHVGVARHTSSAYPAMMQLMQAGDVDFVQVNYSPLETQAEQHLLPLAQDLGIAVTINRPFMNGAYFGLVRGHELPPWAAEFDCESWAQFALKFIVSHPAVNCVLTETANPHHAIDNLGAGLGALPDEAMRQRIVAHLKGLA